MHTYMVMGIFQGQQRQDLLEIDFALAGFFLKMI